MDSIYVDNKGELILKSFDHDRKGEREIKKGEEEGLPVLLLCRRGLAATFFTDDDDDKRRLM